MTDLKFVVDYTDIQTLNRELVGIEKTAKSSASVIEREYNKVERTIRSNAKATLQARKANEDYYNGLATAQKRVAASGQEYYNNLLGIKKAQSDAAASGSVFEKNLEKMKLKYNDSYRAATQFKGVLRDLRAAHMQGAISSERHKESVTKLKSEYRDFLRGTAGWSNQFVTGASRAGKSLNKFGMYSQQFGYQMSDFVVQVQGGTSAFVAFGQQGAQLFGLISGPWGAALSIGAAAVGFFGATWMKTKDQMKEAENGAESLEDRIKSINSTVEEYFRNQEALQKGITPEELDLTGQLEAAGKVLKKSKVELQTLLDLLKEYKGSDVVDVEEALTGAYADEMREALQGVKEAEDELARLRSKQFHETGQELKKSLINSFGEAFEEIYKKLEQLRKEEAQSRLEDALYYFDNYVDAQKAAMDIEKENRKIASEEAAAQAVLDFESAFAAQTFILKVRFEPENEVFGQSLTPNGKMKPKQSWEELVGMGWSPEDLQRIGMTKPKGKKSGGSKSETQEEFLEKLQREIELKKELLGVFGEEKEVMTRVAALKEEVIKKDYQISEAKLEQTVREQMELEKRLSREEQLYDTFYGSISNGMMDLVTGAQSVEEAFKSMLFNILKEIYKQSVVDPVASLGSQILSTLVSAKGNVFSGGAHVKAFATGGVVNGPTMFPMVGSQVGLMGEAGPEAIMPLKRTSSGDLGVHVASSQPTEVVITLSPELVASVLQQAEGNSVRVVQKAAGSIVKASVNAVTNERRKGGTMKAAFG